MIGNIRLINFQPCWATRIGGGVIWLSHSERDFISSQKLVNITYGEQVHPLACLCFVSWGNQSNWQWFKFSCNGWWYCHSSNLESKCTQKDICILALKQSIYTISWRDTKF